MRSSVDWWSRIWIVTLLISVAFLSHRVGKLEQRLNATTQGAIP